MDTMHAMQPGQTVRVTALRADGNAYRWWDAQIEHVSDGYVVTYAPPGHPVYEVDGKAWDSRCHIRAHYWADRWNNLLEVYEPDGRPLELYVHIAAPARYSAAGIAYADHELDVVMPFGKPAEVVDEEDFTAAIDRYRYGEEFQTRCRTAVEQALRLVAGWRWSPLLVPPAAPARVTAAALTSDV